MSRLGKKPIQLSPVCSVSQEGSVVTVKGNLGTLSMSIPERLSVVAAEGSVSVVSSKEYTDQSREIGLYRSLLNNLVVGVSAGYTKTLEIIGVGYKAAAEGNSLSLSLGFSHPVSLAIPAGLKVEVQKGTVVVVSGIDKYLVGQFCSTVKKVRPVEPYKGKGVRYLGETVLLKEGKKK